MKLTEAQIWKCNNDGEGGVHICLDHQNVVDFARAIEREIGFAKAELWIKRINDAVAAERSDVDQRFEVMQKSWADDTKELAVQKYAADNYRRLLDEADHAYAELKDEVDRWKTKYSNAMDVNTNLKAKAMKLLEALDGY